MSRDYRARPFTGRVIAFCSDRQIRDEWSKLVGDDGDLHVTEAEGPTADSNRERWMAVLAELVTRPSASHTFDREGTSRSESEFASPVFNSSGAETASSPVVIEEQDAANASEQRFWLLDQLSEERASYNVTAAMRLDGPLDLSRLERAVNDVARRNKSLRACFRQTADGLAKIICSPETVRVPFVCQDVRESQVFQLDDEIERIASRASRVPIKLDCAPLLRLDLFHLGDDRHVCVITSHHIACDDWSLRLLLREISSGYAQADTAAGTRVMPEASSSNEAAWKPPVLTDAQRCEQLAYWRRHLDGAPPFLELPTDHPRPPSRSFDGRIHRFTIDGQVTRDARELARSKRLTMFMIGLAAFKTLLHCYSHQERIVVGTPIAMRHRREDQTQIGSLLNTLALHTNLEANPTFTELLERVRTTCLGAYAHQQLPFDEVVRSLEPERDPRFTPVFQVLFGLIPEGPPVLELPGVQARPVAADNRTSKCDLVLMLNDCQTHLNAHLEYCTALYDATTAERMSRDYAMLLKRAVESPGLRLNELSADLR